MASVPYSPVPDVVPTAPDPGRVGVDATPNAFGMGVAQAMGRLGQAGEQSSDQIFQTAVQIQALKNETWSRNNFVDQSMKIGAEMDKLYAKTGQAAVDQAPITAATIQQLYKDAVANAPNPQAARMLGDPLSRTISYTLRDIGRHAGAETRRAAGDSAVSVLALDADEVGRRPDDNERFERALANIPVQSGALARLGNGKAEEIALKAKNHLWDQRYKAWAYKDNAAAQASFEENYDRIPTDARATIQQEIKSAESTIRFNNNYAIAARKQQGEDELGQIMNEGRVITPDGRVGFKPDTLQKLDNWGKINKGLDKEVHERMGWVRQANEDAAKGVVVQTDWGHPQVSALTANMFDATNPTREIDVARAENARLISPKDRDWIVNTIKLRDQSDKEALARPDFKLANDTAKLWLEGSTAGEKKFNAGRYMAFQTQFLQQYLTALNDKTLKPGDLDIRNTNGMFRQLVDAYRPGIAKSIGAAGGVAPAGTAPAQTAPETTAAKGTQQNPFSVTTKAERDALPDGVWYTRPDQPGALFPKGKPSKKPPEVSM